MSASRRSRRPPNRSDATDEDRRVHAHLQTSTTNRWTLRRCALTACAAAAWETNPHGVSAQSLMYTSGQPVSPAFEGWEDDADGTRYFVFGYMNKNWGGGAGLTGRTGQ